MISTKDGDGGSSLASVDYGLGIGFGNGYSDGGSSNGGYGDGDGYRYGDGDGDGYPVGLFWPSHVLVAAVDEESCMMVAATGVVG